jgi:pimeloyl-ACP methyl ester carboxylesterase
MLFLGVFLSLSLYLTAQDRNVIWLHGFNGNNTHWEHYANIFNGERQMHSFRPEYRSDTGVVYATDQVFKYKQTDPTSIWIGHSMGGIVIRNEESKGTTKIGGYITVDSPNYGAPVIHAIENGTLLSTVQDALNKLNHGPIDSQLPLPFSAIANLTNDAIANSLINNEFINGLISQYVGGESTIEDLTPNSTILNNINAYKSTKPRISIWGEETSPVHWQLFGSSMVMNGAYENQEDFVDDINATRWVYNAQVQYFNSLSFNHALIGLWGWAAIYKYRAEQWAEGRDWIDDSEDVWCSLIETSRIESQTYWIEVWVPCDQYPIPLKSSNSTNIIDPNCGSWVWVQRTRMVSVNYPSDGFLPQYTQELQGIVPGNRYNILGANHLELLDMSNSKVNGVLVDGTKDKLNEIYNRSDFFQTLVRQ